LYLFRNLLGKKIVQIVRLQFHQTRRNEDAMTRLPLYQVDAFTATRFRGNPAAVVPLEAWFPDDVLQAVAAENNLSETAFIVPGTPDDGAPRYHLRWFTPAVEVDLCGHATLATAYVLATCLGVAAGRIVFESRSGPLPVTREDDVFTLDFPAQLPEPVADATAVAAALKATPPAVLKGGPFLVAVFDDEDNVAGLSPDMAQVAALSGAIGLIATAPGREVDFVSRFFAPQAGIPEDPVTGSAHTVLTPYWAERLGRARLNARQISARGGDLLCTAAGDRVHIGGRCALYLEGHIHL
jgi:PhzF family phenazine biosynthesis protein